jgi:hypothetical protein
MIISPAQFDGRSNKDTVVQGWIADEDNKKRCSNVFIEEIIIQVNIIIP